MPLRGLWARLMFGVTVLAVTAVLGVTVVHTFLVNALGDPRRGVTREQLGAIVARIPGTAQLNARLARLEYEARGDLDSAREHARRAVVLTPASFRFRVLLASIEEARGDRGAAEEAIREAVRLAPSQARPRWVFANVLVRGGQISESIPEFREAVRLDPDLLASSLATVWRATGADFGAMEFVAGPSPTARVKLADFLARSDDPADAARVALSLGPNELAESPLTPGLIAVLYRADPALARKVWERALAREADGDKALSNGGFDASPNPALDQFDWKIASSEFARVRLDPSIGRTAAPSLRIDFTGRDTTRLEREVSQVVLVRPSANYRLEGWVKTDNLVTPEGPRLVVGDLAVKGREFASEPAIGGVGTWRPLVVDFETSPTCNAIQVSVRRRPQFSYDDPTSGTMWVDDLSLVETGGTK